MRVDFLIRLCPLAMAAAAAAAMADSRTITEDFAADPFSHGWQCFGSTNLFQWDATNHYLRVSWDSSQPNSYFYRPLDSILTRQDDFTLNFDLVLDDYQIGTTPGRLSTF